MFSLGLGFARSGETFKAVSTRTASGDGVLTVGIKTASRHRRADGTYIATWKLAIIQEFGNSQNKLFGNRAPIPARPAIGQNWKSNSDKYMRSARSRMVMVKKGTADAATTMGRLGAMIVKDIELSYETWTRPSNAVYTRRKKRRNDPLSHTHKLAKAWSYTWTPSRTPGDTEAVKAAEKTDAGWASLAKALPWKGGGA